MARSRSLALWMSRFGFEGLLGRAEVVPLRLEDVRGIVARGGSILGCSTTSNPFAATLTAEQTAQVAKRLRGRLEELAMDALVLMGGDGTMAIARVLAGHGVPCVGVPKTIDGDLGATERTIGVDTAVETVTRAIDALHSTAEAHQRVMIVEVMGRDAGWIALRAGIAGGADAILIPEIAYDPARVIAKIREREALGLRFSIVVVGEGAHPVGGVVSEVEPALGGRPARLGGAGQRLLAEMVAMKVGHDVRLTVLGHLQRGGAPTAADRLLATRLGAHAAELCAERRFDRMVALKNDVVGSVTFDEACSASTTVDVGGEIVRCARSIGIELGAA